MKVKKEIPNNTDTSSKKLPLGKTIKRDLIRLLWVVLYCFVILFSAMFLVSLLPTVFAYLYSSCGNIIGIDFTNVSKVDLVFWAMCSASIGIIMVVFIISGLRTLLNKWTNAIIKKHVTIKSESIPNK